MKENGELRIPVESAVVAFLVTPEGYLLVKRGLSENGGKLEKVDDEFPFMQHVVGLDLPGGASDGECARKAISRETSEEFEYQFDEERFRRVGSGDEVVLQYRDDKFTRFLVSIYMARISAVETSELIARGAEILENPDDLRPRDRYLFEKYGEYL